MTPDQQSVELGAVSLSIQHRCPDMATHVPFGNAPVPRSRCYSLQVTSQVIPWQPSVPFQSTNPPATQEADHG